MTNSFRHHPDNYIFIDSDDKHVGLTLEEFLELEPKYSGLPEGFIGREYRQPTTTDLGENRIYTRNSEEFESVPFLEGDKYITNIDKYIKKHEANINQQKADREKAFQEEHQKIVEETEKQNKIEAAAHAKAEEKRIAKELKKLNNGSIT